MFIIFSNSCFGILYSSKRNKQSCISIRLVNRKKKENTGNPVVSIRLAHQHEKEEKIDSPLDLIRLVNRPEIEHTGNTVLSIG